MDRLEGDFHQCAVCSQCLLASHCLVLVFPCKCDPWWLAGCSLNIERTFVLLLVLIRCPLSKLVQVQVVGAEALSRVELG
jgi:hypothetical protein